MRKLNYLSASIGAFKGLLSSAVSITPIAHEMVNALYNLSQAFPKTDCDGGCKPLHDDVMTEVLWERLP